MNSWFAILIGGLLSIGVSFYTAVIKPTVELSQIRPLTPGPGEIYPAPMAGSALIGMQIYRSLGCYYCHTRAVKPYEFGSDYERGWGNRRSVARDYLNDNPVLLGSARLGSDLSNIGVREPQNYAVKWQFSSTNKTEQILQRRARNLLILYDPKLLNPDSIMPSFKFLFSVIPIEKQDNLKPATARGEFIFKDKRIIPLDEAERLADFLSSLKREQPLYEAPKPLEPSQKVMKPTSLTNIFRATGNVQQR